VLFFPIPKSMLPAVPLLAAGIWFSRLGFKQLEEDSRARG